MLNASRHHWYFHAGSDVLVVSPLIVLNASRHHWYFHSSRARRNNMYVVCAQRLAASLVLPQTTLQARITRLQVLNASRHHWYFHPGYSETTGSRVPRCSTPRGITGTSTSPPNHKRHPCNWCSTPRGITGTSTVQALGTGKLENLCSTPRGITGTSTRHKGRFAASL